jgi:hypothetical protein
MGAVNPYAFTLGFFNRKVEKVKERKRNRRFTSKKTTELRGGKRSYTEENRIRNKKLLRLL